MNITAEVSLARAFQIVVSDAQGVGMKSASAHDSTARVILEEVVAGEFFVDVQVYGAQVNITRISLHVAVGNLEEVATRICRGTVDGDYSATWRVVLYASALPKVIGWPRLESVSPTPSTGRAAETDFPPNPVAGATLEVRARAAMTLRDPATALETASGSAVQMQVFFGTSRQLIAENGGFSNQTADTLTTGRCTVEVPHGRRTGELDSPLWRRILGFGGSIRVRETELISDQDLMTAIRGQLVSSDTDARQALLFVHGYSVSFDGAIRRAAQLGYDGRIQGPIAAFSWASQGKRVEYIADTAAVAAAEHSLDRFVSMLVSASEGVPLTIVGHSMGCRAVVHMLERRALRGDIEGLGRVILAAPDVDSIEFENISKQFGGLHKRPLVYVSNEDFALQLSIILNAGARAGFAPPICSVASADTVFCGGVDPTFMAHSYFATARTLLTDLRLALLGYEVDSKERGLRSAIGYWELPV